MKLMLVRNSRTESNIEYVGIFFWPVSILMRAIKGGSLNFRVLEQLF